MKLTKTKLKQLIKEELAAIQETFDDPADRVAAAIGIPLYQLTAALKAQGLAIVTAEEAAPEMTPDQEEDLKLAAKHDYWLRGGRGPESPGREGLPRGYES